MPWQEQAQAGPLARKPTAPSTGRPGRSRLKSVCWRRSRCWSAWVPVALVAAGSAT